VTGESEKEVTGQSKRVEDGTDIVGPVTRIITFLLSAYILHLLSPAVNPKKWGAGLLGERLFALHREWGKISLFAP
jgi:hypothetical protein